MQLLWKKKPNFVMRDACSAQCKNFGDLKQAKKVSVFYNPIVWF